IFKIDKSVFNEEVVFVSRDTDVEKNKPYSVIVSNNDKPYLMNNNNEKVKQIVAPTDCKSIAYDDFHVTDIEENKNSIYKISSEISDINKLHVDLSIHLGNRLFNGLITDALWLHNNNFELETLSKLLNSILQATRKKNTQTEYIACPSCGCTLFNISEMLSEVKEATNHLTHLKIAVMGCIVNGPGEMNDADYGYIGAGPGVVSIYKKQNLVLNKIPQQIAVAKLVEVIKLNNDWVEKPVV
ncbi:MAG: flavodoxin-dependent (E)-4-hydroxy-3-methylbut-2-enyl-diphosphate synthase, partial [Lentimicrobiaceae bacterium]|nr:flavodoxin-dependent (E)-4-hydroxy-3-methylbut-2-enyl-diphosphate synthase [Lentimicrobiaceae bacterium]